MTAQSVSSEQTSQINSLSGAAVEVTWPKIVMWTVAFQIAWFWRRIVPLFTEGSMPDTDDYQRLHSVRAFIEGQGWYDLTNYRMDPPAGADMHWSRLVDLPVAGLNLFFGLFTEPVIAERITALVWPLFLLIATVFVILSICRRLDTSTNPLLVLFFTVTCLTALTEFMPGRLDHHSIQILGFCLMLLGMAAASRWWGHLLVGAAAAFSISVGLDAVLMVVLMLGWLGIDWALGRDSHGRGLIRAAAGLAVATPLLYAVNVAPAQWLAAHCDANSIVYLTALMAIAAAFAFLGSASGRLAWKDGRKTFVMRASAGITAAAIAAGGLVWFFPQCAGGPYGAISPELSERWLVNVSEARGLFAQLEEVPQLWFWGIGYGAILLAVGAYVVRRRAGERPEFVAIYAALVISMLASIIQYRAMRIGVFASTPLIVVFIAMVWEAIRQRFANRRLLSGVLQAAVVVALSSPVWLGAAAIVFPDENAASTGVGAVTDSTNGSASWRTDDPYLMCNRASQYRLLASLPRGYVMSDINSGPVIVAETAHDVVGGPYHRNDEAILDMVDFFETDAEKAETIARRRGVDYVAYCEPLEEIEPGLEDNTALAIAVRQGREPGWLTRLSSPQDRLHVFRVNLH